MKHYNPISGTLRLSGVRSIDASNSSVEPCNDVVAAGGSTEEFVDLDTLANPHSLCLGAKTSSSRCHKVIPKMVDLEPDTASPKSQPHDFEFSPTDSVDQPSRKKYNPGPFRTDSDASRKDKSVENSPTSPEQEEKEKGPALKKQSSKRGRANDGGKEGRVPAKRKGPWRTNYVALDKRKTYHSKGNKLTKRALKFKFLVKKFGVEKARRLIELPEKGAYGEKRDEQASLHKDLLAQVVHKEGRAVSLGGDGVSAKDSTAEREAGGTVGPPRGPASDGGSERAFAQRAAQLFRPRGLVASLPSSERLLRTLRTLYHHRGFTDFLPGQLEGIRNVLELGVALVILPTGGGKSLCYQLPSFFSGGLTVVVSPLISLMQDQLDKLPPSLAGVSLDSTHTAEEMMALLGRIRDGKVKIVFVSPEKFCGSAFHSFINSENMPRVALVCIDEAHCITEWSHNFRPSYLRLQHAIKRVNAGQLLALTATATRRTEREIRASLGIRDNGQEPRIVGLRSTVRYSVTMCKDAEEKRTQLLQLLQTAEFQAMNAIIVYTTTRASADSLAVSIDRLVGSPNGQFRMCEAYHAGKNMHERARIQQAFMKNEVKVVCATVAFGMGLDKQDVASVIHFNVPSSVEAFVQESGRAGRNGMAARCHMFLDDEDYRFLHSRINASQTEKETIARLLDLAIRPAMVAKMRKTPPPHSYASMSYSVAEKKCGLAESSVGTMLTYAALCKDAPHRVVTQANCRWGVSFHKTEPKKLAQDPAWSVAGKNFVASLVNVAKRRKNSGRYVVDIAELATRARLTIAEAVAWLKRLRTEREAQLVTMDDAFGILLEMEKDALGLTDEEAEAKLVSTVTATMKRMELHIANQIHKLKAVFLMCKSVASVTSAHAATSSQIQESTKRLQAMVFEYFDEDQDFPPLNYDATVPSLELDLDVDAYNGSTRLRADLRRLISTHPDNEFTGLDLARILHGIWAVRFPIREWANCGYWGAWKHVDFVLVLNEARAICDEHRLVTEAATLAKKRARRGAVHRPRLASGRTSAKKRTDNIQEDEGPQDDFSFVT